MAKKPLAKADLLELGQLPAYHYFLQIWKERKLDLIQSLAYSPALDPLDRAERVGKLKEIDEVLSWLDRQLGRPTVTQGE